MIISFRRGALKILKLNEKLVVFEGIDASGKQTQMEILKEKLEELGHKILSLSFPRYNSTYGELLTSYLNGKRKLCNTERFLLHLLDILEEKEKIKIYLSKGYVVLLDRYYYSTLAYQCHDDFKLNSGVNIVKELGLPVPDIVVYLNIEAKVSINRKIKNEKLDIYEKDIAFLGKVIHQYENIASKSIFDSMWINIDASESKETVHFDIMKNLEKILSNYD